MSQTEETAELQTEKERQVPLQVVAPGQQREREREREREM